MAVKRITTRNPIESFHLYQNTPGCLQFPNVGNV